MFDRILDLHARGKITSFLPWHSGGAPWGSVKGAAAVDSIGSMEPFDIQEVHDFLMEQAALSENSPFNELVGSLMRLPFDRCWFEFTWRPDFRQMGVAAVWDRESASGQDFFLMPLSLSTLDGGVNFRLVVGDVVFRTALDSEGRYLGTEYQSAAQERLSPSERTTVDFGQLLPHDPRYLMTQITRHKYLGLNTNIADAKEFWEFLCWAQPDEAIRLFLQRGFGYSMWGTSREAAIIFLWGDGNNGKGILLNMLDVILGDYSTPAEFKTFSEMGKIGGGGGHGGHSDDLAGLHKKRAASVDETNKGGRFNEGLLKTVTGGAKTMRVSRKGEKGFDMIPMFTFWFASNHKPKLTDTGKSMRRRIKLVKFLNSVEIGKEDTGLADRIIANEGDILLSWMVRGAVEWYKRGLDTPQSVQEWTTEYFHDEDILQHWLDECTEQGANLESRSAEAYLSFAKFSETNGYFKIDQREFKKRLEQKGFVHKPKKYANVYLGFKVTQHFFDEEPKITADMVDAVM